MPAEAEHAKHIIEDIGEEGNIDRVTRLLNLYHAVIVEALYPYTKTDVVTAEEAVPWTDKLEEVEQYRIDLYLPETFSQTTINLLEHWIHEFLVCRCLADWMSIANTEKSIVWMTKAEEAKTEIGKITHHRKSTVRRKMNPF